MGALAFGEDASSHNPSDASASEEDGLVFVEPDWSGGQGGSAGQQGSSGSRSSDAANASDGSAKPGDSEETKEAAEPADDRIKPDEQPVEADERTCQIRIAQCDEALGRAEAEVVTMTKSLTRFNEAIKVFSVVYDEVQSALDAQEKSREALEQAEAKVKEAQDALVSARAECVDQEFLKAIGVAPLSADLDYRMAYSQKSQSSVQYDAAEAEFISAKAKDMVSQVRNRTKWARLETAANRATEAALDVEASCARVRQHDLAASDAFLDLYSTSVEVAEARTRMMDAWLAHDTARSRAQSACGYWYNLLDALSSNQGALTFGTGLDCGLSEEAFVAKWGPAINSFFERQAEQTGRSVPLAGYGDAMARKAYELKMDPRLCAAVAMTETRGGANCVYSFNAWNWKTYNNDAVASWSRWNSWEDAIDAWCKGVSESEMGYSRVVCLSAFGDRYSTDSNWTVETVAYMKSF